MFAPKKKRRKRRSSNDSKAVNWIIIAIIGFALVHNFGKTAGAPGPVAASLNETVGGIKEKSLAGFADYKSKLFPDSGTLFHVEDSAAGAGNAAICGQDATIAYSASKDGQPIDDGASDEKPLIFRIGEHKVMPALEQGVAGMKPGGKRKIFAPFAMSYGIAAFARPDVTEKSVIVFDVELLDASPAIPDFAEIPFRVATIQPGNGEGAGCGEPVKLHLTVWGADGAKLFSPADPITVTPGASDVFLGLEQGVLGLKPGEKRTLFIPPVLQKTLSGKPATVDIPLPENQTVLIDVERVP